MPFNGIEMNQNTSVLAEHMAPINHKLHMAYNRPSTAGGKQPQTVLVGQARVANWYDYIPMMYGQIDTIRIYNLLVLRTCWWVEQRGHHQSHLQLKTHAIVSTTVRPGSICIN